MKFLALQAAATLMALAATASGPAAAAGATIGTSARPAAKGAPAVAIFDEPDFPFYIATPDSGPDFARSCLHRAGIGCETVNAAELANPKAFNARRYRVLVYTYGNSFPLAATANLRAFHAAGGCILALGGVPFCHPCVREGGKWVDKIGTLGWNFLSQAKIGTGLWGDAADVTRLAHAAGDPLGLGWLPLPPAPTTVQFPAAPMTRAEAKGAAADDPRLPPGDRLTPVVVAMAGGKVVGAPVCIAHHNSPAFRGAVDIWAGTTIEPLFTLQQREQILVASCAYLLKATGAIAEARRQRILAATRRRYVAPITALPPDHGPFLLRSRPPATHLTVLDVTGLPPDEQTLALTLQGIVNRRQPRIYLVGNFRDRTWLTPLEKRGHTADEVDDLGALLGRYRGEIAGAIIADPSNPDTVNIATMLAGLDRAVVATPALAARYRLKTVEDLRGRWKTGLAAYEWALRDLWPRLKPKALACMAPDWVAPRDYLVQHPIFIFWLDCRTDKPLSPEQGLFLDRLMAKMPPRSAVYGWWQEGDTGGIGEGRGVHISSQYGKITVCTSGAYNLSVHSGMPMPKTLHQAHPPAGSLGRKVYVSFVVSDGDNFGMDMYSVIEGHWDDRMRGRVPVGWGICPTQVELTPDLVDYWYRTASPRDEFVCMDGLGYVYPDVYGAALGDHGRAFDDFLRESGRYMRRLDQRELWFLNGTERAPEMARVLGHELGAGFNGLLGEYGVPPQQRQEMIGHVAALWSDVNPWQKPWDQVQVYVDRIRKRTPATRPAFLFVGVNGFAIGPDRIAAILRELGPGYVAVRPDELCDLFRRWKTAGVDANPAPRAPLDLTPPPPPAPTTTADGTLIAAEHGEQPTVGGWFTDPAGTAWVRKRLSLKLPPGAREATIRAYVRGKAGNHVTFRVNGKEHTVRLDTSRWTWAQVKVPAAELRDGENEVWYTGNPDGRLYTAGDSTLDLGHSDFGGPGGWSPLGGELMITVEVR